MEIFFKRTFLKDYKRLPKELLEEVKEICNSIFPRIKNLADFKEYPIRKIRGFKNYYRIKIGDFRIGFKKSDNQVIFMRVLHRKDIYKYFP